MPRGKPKRVPCGKVARRNIVVGEALEKSSAPDNEKAAYLPAAEHDSKLKCFCRISTGFRNPMHRAQTFHRLVP